MLRTGCLILLTTVFMVLTGCSSISYYGQAISGHLDIMADTQSLQTVLAQDELDDTLRRRLLLAQEVRRFASDEMKLPDNDSYTDYVDLGRDYAVWNLVATEPYSVEPKSWCFLFVGCVPYKGYFDRADAEAEARQLAGQGLDVMTGPVDAYSTLGWFDDPLTNTILDNSEADLISLMIHELAHQQLYVENDTAFNEAFATAVANEGVKRWYRQQNDDQSYRRYLQHQQRRADFLQLLIDTRARLQAAYAEDAGEARKQAIFRILKQQHYADFKKRWDNYAGYDNYMRRDLNNAHLALVATYHEQVPMFEKMIAEAAGNMELFYEQVARLHK